MTRFDISLIAGAAITLGLCGDAATAPTRADSFMDGVKAEVVKFAGPQSDWRGPTSAPKPDPGKLIVYMSTDEQNDASREWGQAIQEAGPRSAGRWSLSTAMAPRSDGNRVSTRRSR